MLKDIWPGMDGGASPSDGNILPLLSPPSDLPVGRYLRAILSLDLRFHPAPDGMSLEEIFSTSELEVVVPDTSFEFPTTSVSVDEWLGRVKIGKVERKQAFFGTC